MPAVDAESGTLAAPSLRPFAKVRNGHPAFRDGDVIMAKITPCMENGKAAVVRGLKNGIGFGSTEFHVFRPTPAVLAEHVYHFIRQESFREAAAAEMTGSVGQKRVPADFLKQVTLPLPPLAEQQRIVAKVEALLARLNAARQRLAKAPAILKRFRQSVLGAACSGRLTADWRQTQDDLEPDDGESPVLWKDRPLSEICTAFEYGSSQKSEKRGKVPVLRMGNIQDGAIDWSELAYSNDDDEIAKYSLAPNTVLFNRTNSPELVGKTGLYRGERPAIFAGYLIRIRTGPELDPVFLNLCLNAPPFKEYCLGVRTDGVSQSNINARKLAQYSINWCPVPEQHEIVRRVEALFRLADAVDKRVAAAMARADKLTQAILAKAFRGELVPTEAELARREGRDYEPASVLLERIRAEKAAASSSKPQRQNGQGIPRRDAAAIGQPWQGLQVTAFSEAPQATPKKLALYY